MRKLFARDRNILKISRVGNFGFFNFKLNTIKTLKFKFIYSFIRYCLFGHNVTIANKFESGSEAGRINVSPTTKKALQAIPEFKFGFIPRDPSCLPKEYKVEAGETCYFLDGYKHAGIDEKENLQVHIDAATKYLNAADQN